MRSRPMRARCILGPLSTGSLHMGPLDTGPLYARPLVKVCQYRRLMCAGPYMGPPGLYVLSPCVPPLLIAPRPKLGSFRKSQRVGLQRFADYFRVALCGFRKRTPSPALSSSMNSIPAASSACRMAASFAAVTGISPSITSTRRIVATPTFDSRAKSSALKRSIARAARI